jgi:cytoskeletal protein CcmA (bactofilin family)
MFRRPGKNPLEDYKEELSAYQYSKEQEARIYENPPRAQPLATPMNEVVKEEKWLKENNVLPHHFKGMVHDEDPETTLGEGVTFRGELSFERLLRIDGTFEGELLSQGKVIVGPKGKVKANLNLREAIIEGVIEGNITVQEKLELRGQASIRGDIKAKSLVVDDGVEILGVVQVSRNADSSNY